MAEQRLARAQRVLASRAKVRIPMKVFFAGAKVILLAGKLAV